MVWFLSSDKTLLKAAYDTLLKNGENLHQDGYWQSKKALVIDAVSKDVFFFSGFLKRRLDRLVDEAYKAYQLNGKVDLLQNKKVKSGLLARSRYEGVLKTLVDEVDRFLGLRPEEYALSNKLDCLNNEIDRVNNSLNQWGGSTNNHVSQCYEFFKKGSVTSKWSEETANSEILVRTPDF